MKIKIKSVNISSRKGTGKTSVPEAQLKPDHGLIGDAHAAPGIKQVSLLAWESICKQNEHLKALGREKEQQSPEVNKKNNGDSSSSKTGNQKKENCKFASGVIELKPGDFGENITTQGINLVNLKVGTRLKIGNGIELEVTKIGKECHRYCAIYYKTGDCIMPGEGIFCLVAKGGFVKTGDPITIV